MTSTQHLLDKIRPPRVQITYDVEIGNAIEVKELPFVVGVISDLSGDRDPDIPLPPLKKRKFSEIDCDSFNDIMASIGPRLVLEIPDKITNGTLPLGVTLHFNTLDDFGPVPVIQQIPQMADLYGIRSCLRDLLSKLDGNDTLDALLTNILTSPALQGQLSKDLAPPQEPAPVPAQPSEVAPKNPTPEPKV